MDDLINIRRRDTDTKASVNVGSLVEIKVDNEIIFGIVLFKDEKTMKLQTPNGDIKWMSLYVNYRIIQ